MLASPAVHSPHTVHYHRTLDSIDALRIQTVLYSTADHSALVSLCSSDMPSNLTSQTDVSADRHLVARLTVDWQEKVFGPDSLAVDSRTNPTVRRHTKSRRNRQLQSVHDSGGIVLFTYIDQDNYIDMEWIDTPVMTGVQIPLIKSANQIQKLNQDGIAVERAADIYRNESVNVNDSTTMQGNGQWKNATSGMTCQTMYIMASIPHTSQPSKSGLDRSLTLDSNNQVVRVEKCLCSIRCYSSGLMAISPGFVKDETSLYSFQIGQQTYEYAVSAVCGEMTKEEIKEQDIFEEFHLQNAMKKLALISKPFDNPVETGYARLLICGELISASGFDGDWIYAEYNIDIANGIKLHSKSSTSGTSQVAEIRKDTHANFSLPFEVILVYNVGSTVVSNLLIKVTSVDSKDRHIIQGYGAMPIPDQPGYYQETLPTWCPEQSPMHKMKSFFLGGSPELQDLKYIRDTDIKSKVVNKYGFKTRTSGSLNIRMSVSRQHSLEPYGETSTVGQSDKERSEHSDVLLRARARLEALKGITKPTANNMHDS
ncbi:hypothetical protein BDV3_000702 [Batrachochytrium dendrobatidis]